MKPEELAIMRTDDLAIERYTRQPMPTLRDIIAVLFRQRWPMLAAFALVVIAVAVSGVWIPKYEAQMKILALRQRSDAMVTPSANAPAQFSNDQVSEEDLNSEVELLNSDDLLRKVVLTTGLAGQSGSSTDGGSASKSREGSAQIKQRFEDRTPAQDQCDFSKLSSSRSEDGGRGTQSTGCGIHGKAPGSASSSPASLSSSTSKRSNTSRD